MTVSVYHQIARPCSWLMFNTGYFSPGVHLLVILNVEIEWLLLFVKYVVATFLITGVYTHAGWESVSFDIEEYTCSFPSCITGTLGLSAVDHKSYATVHWWKSNSNKINTTLGSRSWKWMNMLYIFTLGTRLNI